MFDKTAELYDLFYDWKDYRAEAAHDPQGLMGRGLWIAQRPSTPKGRSS